MHTAGGLPVVWDFRVWQVKRGSWRKVREDVILVYKMRNGGAELNGGGTEVLQEERCVLCNRGNEDVSN